MVLLENPTDDSVEVSTLRYYFLFFNPLLIHVSRKWHIFPYIGCCGLCQRMRCYSSGSCSPRIARWARSPLLLYVILSTFSCVKESVKIIDISSINLRSWMQLKLDFLSQHCSCSHNWYTCFHIWMRLISVDEGYAALIFMEWYIWLSHPNPLKFSAYQAYSQRFRGHSVARLYIHATWNIQIFCAYLHTECR